jgi:hypothetical protein
MFDLAWQRRTKLRVPFREAEWLLGSRHGNHRFGNGSDINDGGIRSAGGIAVDACHVRGGRRVLVYAGRVDLELADDDCQRGDVCSDNGDHRDEAISEVKCALESQSPRRNKPAP